MLLILRINSSMALVILQYHHVSDKTLTSTSVTSARFEQHLTYLEDNLFQILDLSEVKKLLEANKPLPEQFSIKETVGRWVSQSVGWHNMQLRQMEVAPVQPQRAISA